MFNLDSSRSTGASDGKRQRRDYTPSSWNEYFETKQLVEVDGDISFHTKIITWTSSGVSCRYTVSVSSVVENLLIL